METTGRLQGSASLKEIFTWSNVIHFIYNLSERDNHIRRIMLHSQDKVNVVDLDEVLYIMAMRGYCEICTVGGKKYVSAKSLSEYEDLLAPLLHFTRANKSYIINIRQVHSYSKGTNCFIYMRGSEQEIEVSRRKRKQIMDLLKQKTPMEK